MPSWGLPVFLPVSSNLEYGNAANFNEDEDTPVSCDILPKKKDVCINDNK